MIAKRLLNKFEKMNESEKMNYLFDSVKDGTLTKEEFAHLLYDYALAHPKYPPTYGDCW